MVSRRKYTGKSLIEQMWEILDDLMDVLMTRGSSQDLVHLKGRAYGVAECIALMTNPIHRDVDDVRERAVERWRARSNGEPCEHPGDGVTQTTATTLTTVKE